MLIVYALLVHFTAKIILDDIQMESVETTVISVKVNVNGNVTRSLKKYISYAIFYYELSPTGRIPGNLGNINRTAWPRVTIPGLKPDTTYSVWVKPYRKIDGQSVGSPALEKKFKTGQ